MIDRQYHIELNGVGYRLAEDAEGQHYIRTYEPLRPPNAGVVQGEQSAKFQVRPDTLLWSLTDWSGGAGQVLFDLENPNRHRELRAVRAFERPGVLQPGFYVEEFEVNGSAYDKGGLLAVVDGKLALKLLASPDVLLVESGTETTLNTAGLGGASSVWGDTDNLYFVDAGTNSIYKWSGSGTSVTALDTTGVPTDPIIAALGPVVYAAGGGEVWEVSISGGSPVEVYNYTGTAVGLYPLNGRMYLLVQDNQTTHIHELTPTTAAGPGFGVELTALPGLTSQALWAHSGLLFIGGVLEESEEQAIFYVAPDGALGTLGPVELDDAIEFLIAGPNNSAMLSHFFATYNSAASGDLTLYQVDSISGGMAAIASIDLSVPVIYSLAYFKGDLYASALHSGPAERLYRARRDRYAVDSYAISSWHDFTLADEKLLGSIVLACEPLPADWTVYVDYARDGVDSWTNAITYTTDNGTGTKVAVSTDSSTITFRTLSIRIRMEYTGSGAPTTAPAVLGVDVMATVVQPQKVWRLLLDLADDSGEGLGERRIANLVTAATSKVAVQLNDGYRSRKPGQFDAHDVIVDQCDMVLHRPGEGVAHVLLREVP